MKLINIYKRKEKINVLNPQKQENIELKDKKKWQKNNKEKSFKN